MLSGSLMSQEHELFEDYMDETGAMTEMADPYDEHAHFRAWMQEHDPEPTLMVGDGGSGARIALKPLYLVALCFGLISDGVGIFTNFQSKFYYFNFGLTVAGFIARTFALIDHLTVGNAIEPMKPWVRYGNGVAP